MLGTLATFDNAGTIDLSPGQYAAAALITAGAGLLIGSVFGRARSLIFWGLLLVPFILFADTTDIPFSQGTGERIYTPIAAGDVNNDYELFAGHMVFQLDDMEWDSEPLTIDANVFMGQMEIFVPQGVDVRFEGHAEMGGLRFFDIERTGTDVNLNIDEDTGNGPELVLNTDVFMGEVVVHRTEEQAKELS